MATSLLKKTNIRQKIREKAEQRKGILTPYDAHENSFKIIVTLRPTKTVMPVIETFFKEKILPAFTENKSRTLKEDDKISQFSCLTASLLLASNQRPLRVSLNNNYYRNHKNLSTFIIFLVNWLYENKYVDKLKGFNFPHKDGRRRTRIWPTDLLREELLSKLEIYSNPDICSDSDLVILRNTAKKKIWYRDNSITKQLKPKIQAINRCNSNHRVTLPDKKKEKFVITDLHCVFNNSSFEDNGRFYTGNFGYQSLPKEDRNKLLINGHHTIELDFSGLHPRLLYAMKGIQFDDNPYSIVTGDKTLRPILKKLLLTLFNTENYANAVRAGNYSLLTNDGRLKEILNNSEYTIKELLEVFKKAHEPIAEYFCTKQGYNLTNIDSQIALTVMEYFAYIGEACLCVHDSFIVEERLEQDLRTTMELSYRRITKNISPDHRSYDCKICRN